VPLSHRKDCNFSFAGLKTAVRYGLIREHQRVHGLVDEKHGKQSNNFKGMKGVATVPVDDATAFDMAWAFQNSATKHLQKRLERAISWVTERESATNSEEVSSSRKVRQVVVCGGVASNAHIRQELTKTANSLGYFQSYSYFAAILTAQHGLHLSHVVLSLQATGTLPTTSTLCGQCSHGRVCRSRALASTPKFAGR